MWFSVVCTLIDIDNDTRHHSSQNLMWTHEAQPSESTTFWPLLWRVWLSIRVQTTLNHIRFVKYAIQIKNEILKSQLQLEPKASGFDRVCSFPWLERCEKKLLKNTTIYLAYGWRTWNLNWSIRIQQAWKTSLSWRKGKLAGIAVESHNVFHWRWHWIFTKHMKHMKHFLSPGFQFGAKHGFPASSMATRS